MLRVVFLVFVVSMFVAIGCKAPQPAPPYVGTYRLLMTDELKQTIAQLNANYAAEHNLTPEQNAAESKEVEEGFAASGMTINADGTCTRHTGGPNPADEEGTYTVSGNRLTATMSPTDTESFTFDPAKGTLMNDAHGKLNYVKK